MKRVIKCIICVVIFIIIAIVILKSGLYENILQLSNNGSVKKILTAAVGIGTGIISYILSKTVDIIKIILEVINKTKTNIPQLTLLVEKSSIARNSPPNPNLKTICTYDKKGGMQSLY